jgi:tetratricopeptide (TPR) repeat protein
MMAAIAGWSQLPADYAAAEGYVKSGQPLQAIPILRGLLSKAPRDLKARNLLGIALLNAGRTKDAAVEFQEALRIDPDFQPALKNRGIGEMALGHRDEAKRCLERLLQLAPADPVAHLYMGEIMFAEQRYPEALSHYRQSSGLDLKDPPVVLHVARSAVESGQYTAAEEALEHLGPDASQLHFEAGLLLAGVGRFDAAARQFQFAHEYPDRYQAGFNLALVYLRAGRFTSAIEAAEPLVRAYPKAELYNLLARAYDGAGRTQDAYDALRNATRLDPRDERNYTDLMALCLTHEDWNLSLEIAEVALEHIPSAWRVRLQRGAVFAIEGKLEQAAGEFLAARRMAPDASQPAAALAVVEIERKDLRQAVETLRAYRGRHAEDYLIDWLLGGALIQSGAEQEAVEPLEQAMRLNPNAAAPRLLLGKVFAKRGDSQAAIQLFEEALQRSPNDTSAAYQLALLYRKTGNSRRAEELMSKVANATSVPDTAPVTVRDLVRIVR